MIPGAMKADVSDPIRPALGIVYCLSESGATQRCPGANKITYVQALYLDDLQLTPSFFKMNRMNFSSACKKQQDKT